MKIQKFLKTGEQVVVYEGLLSKEQCNELIAYTDDREDRQPGIPEDCKFFDFVENDESCANKVYGWIKDELEKDWVVNYVCPRFHIIKYKKDYCPYAVHRDCLDGSVQVLIYPTGDYIGGELRVYDYEGDRMSNIQIDPDKPLVHIEPMAGNVVVFKTGIFHSVTKTLSGCKYICILSLFEGPETATPSEK